MDEQIVFKHVKERVCECVELPRRTQDRILWHPLANTGLSKKMDGILNRYKLNVLDGFTRLAS
jgi:hypothetical protein